MLRPGGAACPRCGTHWQGVSEQLQKRHTRHSATLNSRGLERSTGILRITTPDLDKYMRGYVNRETDPFLQEHARRRTTHGRAGERAETSAPRDRPRAPEVGASHRWAGWASPPRQRRSSTTSFATTSTDGSTTSKRCGAAAVGQCGTHCRGAVTHFASLSWSRHGWGPCAGPWLEPHTHEPSRSIPPLGGRPHSPASPPPQSAARAGWATTCPPSSSRRSRRPRRRGPRGIRRAAARTRPAAGWSRRCVRARASTSAS